MNKKFYFPILLLFLLIIFKYQQTYSDQEKIFENIKNIYKTDYYMIITFGGKPEDIVEVDSHLKGIGKYDDPSWVKEWSEIGNSYVDLGESLIQQENYEEAKDAFLKASVYYGVAKLPYPGTAEKKLAYKKRLDAYLMASQFFDPPLEKIKIPYEGKEIIGYLRIPSGYKKVSCVIIIGGLHGWKEDHHLAAEELLKKNIAVFSIDTPGTGESQWKLTPDGEKIFVKVIDYLASRSEIDSTAIGIWGISFGGHWSVKLAAVDQRIKACVNQGGPIHHAFKLSNALKVPWNFIVKSILFARGKRTYELLSMPKFMHQMLLKNQGLIDKIKSPLLIVNGKNDELVPLSDIFILIDKGSDNTKEVRLFPDDFHAAVKNTEIVYPYVAEWFLRNLYKSKTEGFNESYID